MELDPLYTPSFWNGSLSSIHSTYEKLGNVSIESGAEKCNDSYESISSEQQVLADVLARESHNDSGENPEHDDSLSVDAASDTDDDDGIDCVFYDTAPERVSATAGGDSEVQTRMRNPSAKNFHQETIQNILNPITEHVGISEDSINELECGEEQGRTGSGYRTESLTDTLFCDGSGRHQSCNSIALRGEDDSVFTGNYAASSGYASGFTASETTDKETESVQAHYQPSMQLPYHNAIDTTVSHRQTDGDSTDCTGSSYDVRCTEGRHSLSTDTQNEDLDSVKFTVNPNQEFEYVNTVEASDITFEIKIVQ